MTHHLAQLNIARLRHPLDAPEIAGFVDALDPINAAADAAPGFVWRRETDEGNATSIRAFGDDMLIVNLSLWRSVEALRDVVYRGDHLSIMRQRGEWFERMAEAYLVLWWVPAGTFPTVAQATGRLEMLRRSGPAPEAFTLRKAFDLSGVPAAQR